MKFYIYGIALCLIAATGASNESGVVINEIMYHSANDLDEDEYIELYNRGDEAVDLSGWFFSDGIRYSFPSGTILDAGGYLVVAKNAAKIREKYGLDVVYGDYFGELSNEGERVALANIDGDVVDEVEYSDSPPWPVSADEFGPSLECINPNEDNARPAAWSVTLGDVKSNSGASGVINDTAVWPMEYRHASNGNQSVGVHFSRISIPLDSNRRVIRLRLPNEPRIQVFAVSMLINGEITPVNLDAYFDGDGISHADNPSDGNLDGSGSTIAAELLPADGILRFESAVSPVEWTLGPYSDGENNFVLSIGRMISLPRVMGSQLEILATAVNTDTVTADFSIIYSDGEEAVSARMTGWFVPGSDNISIPPGEGTPGSLNSVFQETLPPFVEECSHDPENPLSTDIVTIRARISCGEAIDSVRLHSWVENEDGWLDMNDDGRNGDAMAGDGEYAAQLDPQRSQTVVFYSVRVVDALGRERYSPLETDPTPRHGYLVSDGEAPSDLPLYFIFIDEADLNQLNRNPNSDEMVPAVVAIDGQVFDGVRVRYRGAWARSWPKKNWKVRFNKGRYYKGWRTSNLNGEYHDRAYMREKIGYELFEYAGVPHPEARFVWMQLNGEPFGLYCEIEQPDERFLERIGRDGASLYKSEGRYNVLGSESQYVQTYQKETNVTEPYTALIDMIGEINSISDGRVYDYFVQYFNIETYIDYLIVNACISNWDSIVKNHMVVQDVALTGKWDFIPWDLDRTWGEFRDWNIYFNQDILAGIQGHPGPQLGSDWWNRVQDRFLNNEIFLEMYYNRMRQFLETVFSEERIGALIDECDALIRDETPLERQIHGLHGSWNYADEVENLKQYVRQRREFLFQSMPVDVGEWQLY